MRVYISACGIGLGHAGRCIPIAQELKKRGHEVVFSSYGDATDFIKREGFTCFKTVELMWGEKNNGAVSVGKTLLKTTPIILKFFRQIVDEIKWIQKFKPDIILSDSRFSTILASRQLDIPCYTLISQPSLIFPPLLSSSGIEKLYKIFLKIKKFKKITESIHEIEERREKILKKFHHFGEVAGTNIMFWLLHYSKKIFIPDLPPPYSLMKNYFPYKKSLQKKILYTGLIVRLKPECLDSKEEIMKKYNLSHNFILARASGPGYLKKRLSEKLIKILTSTDNDSILICKDMKNKKIGNLRIFNWVDDKTLYELLKISNMVISLPGYSSISEYVYYGIPMFLVPIPNQSEHLEICKRIKELKLGSYVEMNELNGIEKIFDPNSVDKFSRIAKSLNSTEIICNSLHA